MVKKFFPFDKNYLLENAQHRLENELLSQLVTSVIIRFDEKMNPLGLLDSFSLKIRNYKVKNVSPLHNFYEKVSAIYRYKHGENQLEFLWDGSDHIDYYQNVWKKTFEDWMEKFCLEDLFIQAVLDLTVFNPDDEKAQMIENRMNHFVFKFFGARIHKSKGLMVA